MIRFKLIFSLQTTWFRATLRNRHLETQNKRASGNTLCKTNFSPKKIDPAKYWNLFFIIDVAYAIGKKNTLGYCMLVHIDMVQNLMFYYENAHVWSSYKMD